MPRAIKLLENGALARVLTEPFSWPLRSAAGGACGSGSVCQRSTARAGSATITSNIIIDRRRTSALCMDRRCSRNDPFPKLGLGHADIVRASHLQHAIEGVDRHVNFSRPTFVYT